MTYATNYDPYSIRDRRLAVRHARDHQSYTHNANLKFGYTSSSRSHLYTGHSHSFGLYNPYRHGHGHSHYAGYYHALHANHAGLVNLGHATTLFADAGATLANSFNNLLIGRVKRNFMRAQISALENANNKNPLQEARENRLQTLAFAQDLLANRRQDKMVEKLFDQLGSELGGDHSHAGDAHSHGGADLKDLAEINKLSHALHQHLEKNNKNDAAKEVKAFRSKLPNYADLMRDGKWDAFTNSQYTNDVKTIKDAASKLKITSASVEDSISSGDRFTNLNALIKSQPEPEPDPEPDPEQQQPKK